MACGSTPAPKPSPPLPIENHTRTCSEAAVGLEQATRSIRPPESSVVQIMRGRCADDRWGDDAIDCFAQMTEGDLGRCAGKLPEDARRQMFGALGGGDETAVAIARLRLAGMHVGIPACDALWVTTSEYLSCDAVPLATRAELGPQIADSWNLPDRLPPDAQTRMTAVCTRSRETVLQQAVAAGCPITQ
ncbi:MAG: hypothetical protein ABI591_26815 [Kofleriaceae bacterium]